MTKMKETSANEWVSFERNKNKNFERNDHLIVTNGFNRQRFQCSDEMNYQMRWTSFSCACDAITLNEPNEFHKLIMRTRISIRIVVETEGLIESGAIRSLVRRKKKLSNLTEHRNGHSRQALSNICFRNINLCVAISDSHPPIPCQCPNWLTHLELIWWMKCYETPSFRTTQNYHYFSGNS